MEFSLTEKQQMLKKITRQFAEEYIVPVARESDEKQELNDTVYQKMKRSRGGEVFLLFYENTSEQDKVKRVVSEIAVRYPWSLIFYTDK